MNGRRKSKAGCVWSCVDTVHTERYEAVGLEGLRDQSRAPAHHPNEVVPEVADAVLEMRRAQRRPPENLAKILKLEDGE